MVRDRPNRCRCELPRRRGLGGESSCGLHERRVGGLAQVCSAELSIGSGGSFGFKDRLSATAHQFGSIGSEVSSKRIELCDKWDRPTKQVPYEAGFDEAPVHPSICFTDAEWGFFSKPIRLNGVLVTWSKDLVEQIRMPGPYDMTTIDLLARELSDKLPASK